MSTGEKGAMTVRANMWRGDRALGGRLAVEGDRLRFTPHGMERTMGGDTRFDVALRDVTRLTKASRSKRMPRARLIVTTADGHSTFFLVSKLDRVINRLLDAVRAAGGEARIGTTEEDEPAPPELQPDDSAAMNLIYSGWTQVVGLVIFSIPVFLVLLLGSRNTVGLVLVGALIALQAWLAWRGFRRKARLKAARAARA